MYISEGHFILRGSYNGGADSGIPSGIRYKIQFTVNIIIPNGMRNKNKYTKNYCNF